MLRNLKEFKLPEIEEKVLKFWKENHVVGKVLKLREKAKKFRFFEGPPTANGRPGIHHVLSRSLKDVILRYKTMRGYFVRRQAGWDTHGLPVEIETENNLGLKNKQEIEKFGIAEFNEKAKALIWKYLDEWEKLTDRIGFWLDMKNPYITYNNNYIESLWWVFGQIAKRKLLARNFKVVPWCPRCQTPLSSHELGQPGAYQRVKDPSIYIKFEISNSKKEFLLVWTTTPWTLPSNVAIAINPKLTYTKYQVGDEYLWAYNPPSFAPQGGATKGKALEPEVIEKISGKKLIGLRYKPLFNIPAKGGSAPGGNGLWSKNKNFFKVYGADFVETTEGTGLVHIAPAFGEDDMSLVKEILKVPLKADDIPITIDERGIVQRGLPGAGKFAKEADKDIVKNLSDKKLLFYQGIVEHEYPFCWRCATPLLYFARFSWFIEMSKLRKELLKNNKKINWIPEHVKEGRFGEWLREVKDWAISRDRYWGTPLPIWQCEKWHANSAPPPSAGGFGNAKAPTRMKKECNHIEVIGSLEDLNRFRYTKNNFWILRHGEADHNLKNIIASGPENGDRVSNLTKIGIQQIEKAANELLKQLGKEKLDLIVTSPYLRTKAVSKIVAKATKAKILVDKRFEELNTGVYNGRPVLEHGAFFDSPLERFTKKPPGGENWNDVKKRTMEGVLELNSKYNNKNILIVGHGDPLWVLEGTVRNLSNEEILKMVDIKPGELRKLPLGNWPYNTLTFDLDLHRPYIDGIYLKCPKCSSKMIRVKEVADVWFDSGAMPFAQFHYPFGCAKSRTSRTNADFAENSQRNQLKSAWSANLKDCVDFPADYISEAIDQTRGWFYTLLAISTALGLKSPYLNVICHGLVLDKNGQKMSKSKGNVVDPWLMIEKYGADIVRWYFYTINPPGEPKRFDEADLGKMYRKFIMLIYNSFVFLDTYGNQRGLRGPSAGFADNNSQRSRPGSATSVNVLDKWILSRLNQTILQTTEDLDKYDVGGAGKVLEAFVDDLSRWYIRRSRRRFQKPESQKDLEMVSAVLRHALMKLSKLMAPFAPFFSEALYQSFRGLRGSNADFAENSRQSGQLKSAGSAMHSVHLEDWPIADKNLLDIELLNKMDEIRRLASLVLALRAEKGIKVRQPLSLLEIKSKKLDIRDKELLDLLKGEVNVKEVKLNLEIKDDIKLDTVITAELKNEGSVRDFIRLVQGLRQSANLTTKDNIYLLIEADDEAKRVLMAGEDLIKKEVGAKIIEFKKSDKFNAELDSKLNDQPIWIGLRKI